jgi:1,4-dihydroxy-2-naphthoyl-CoA hydrolase
MINIDPEQETAFGLEINANHLRSKRSGLVTARAIPLHRGKMTHVWEIKLFDEQEQLLCVARCTIAVVNKRRDISAGDAGKLLSQQATG